jgi:hypothetical protein
MGLLEAGQSEVLADLPEPGGDQAAPGVAERPARRSEGTLLRTEAVRKLSAQG